MTISSLDIIWSISDIEHFCVLFGAVSMEGTAPVTVDDKAYYITMSLWKVTINFDGGIPEGYFMGCGTLGEVVISGKESINFLHLYNI